MTGTEPGGPAAPVGPAAPDGPAALGGPPARSRGVIALLEGLAMVLRSRGESRGDSREGR